MRGGYFSHAGGETTQGGKKKAVKLNYPGSTGGGKCNEKKKVSSHILNEARSIGMEGSEKYQGTSNSKTNRGAASNKSSG